MDEMKEIVICRYCGKEEEYGKMRWLNGRCECKKCYKSHWEEVNHQLYI